AGEALVVAYALKLLPTWGFLPAVPVIAGSVAAYLVTHLVTGPAGWPIVEKRQVWFMAGFVIIFAAAQDFWRWGESGTFWLGWPVWAWYFVGLSTLQTILMIRWLRPAEA
ncbi:MAG: hypothetical protein SV487_12205, partial [Thermodesulfobacteriota bacterium]|nr:hypothetical protein [Thermodesulfobacteriota bacterium]